MQMEFSHILILKTFNKEEFNSKIIKSNIKEIINYDDFYLNTRCCVKDILIDNENIYVSFSNQLNEKLLQHFNYICKINLEFLNFKKFLHTRQMY